MKKKILYLYTGDHAIHRKFAESVNADIKKLSWKIPRGYDIYFSEGEFFKLVILKILGKISKKSKIINLFSDPRLFYMDRGIKFNLEKQKIEKTSKFKKLLFKDLVNRLDGVICVAGLEEELLKKFYKGPIGKVDIFVGKKFRKKLSKIKPNLNSEKILFIGNGPDIYYKGIDLLLEVAKKNPGFEFSIVGKNYEDFLKLRKIPKNLKFLGELKMNSKEFEQVFKEHALYLHLGRGEAFGITIVEAMVAGIPCIVSNLTGAREAASKVRKDSVIDLDINSISSKISEYFQLSTRKKKSLSKKSQKISKFYDEDVQLKNFKKTFDKLLGRVYERN